MRISKGLFSFLLICVMVFLPVISGQASEGVYTYETGRDILAQNTACTNQQCSQHGAMQFRDTVYRDYRRVYLNGVYVRTEELGTSSGTEYIGCNCVYTP